MEKSKRGIQLSISLFSSLYEELIDTFSKHYNIDVKTLKVFQLYGFGDYDETGTSLKKFIYEQTKDAVNGKYLYNKVKLFENSSAKTINLSRDYLNILIRTIGYKSYRDFIKKSSFVTDAIRDQEDNLLSSSIKYDSVLYYVGYYVEDKNYFIKSKLTIYEGKSVDWDIRYWETDDKPSFYSYSGKVVMNSDSALSFYFSKENSNIKKECFVNVFFGNNMRIKPILLGSYCGFERNNNPVVGKIIFERVNTIEEQSELVLSKAINPIFYQQLYSKRISVEGLLPHEISELAPSANYHEIINYLTGDYYGFFLDKNEFFIPITFKILNESAQVVFHVNNKKYNGIGRLSAHENYLNVEFDNEHDNNSCSFSLQIKPIDNNLFSCYILVNVGVSIFCGQVLLWKDNEELKQIVEKNSKFSFGQFDLDTKFINKIYEHSSISTSTKKSLLSKHQTYVVPESLKGSYEIEIMQDNNKTNSWNLRLDQNFEIDTANGIVYGNAFYMNGNICLIQLSINDISILGLSIIFVGNTSKKQIIKKRGVSAGYDEDNKPISLNITLTSS